MALSQMEINQCKYILGYAQLTALAMPYFDIAVVFEDVVQKSLDITFAETYIRGTILLNYFALDAQIQSSATRLQATELVGDLKLDARNEMRGLLDLKEHWANELSKALGIPRVRKGADCIELM